MELDPNVCYKAVLTRDPRFDGAFFTGVRTTRVYCRTVCTAKTPHQENCSFHPSAAAAERAGYRPCLVCRPELAPGNARVDAVGRWAAAALGQIEDELLAEKSLDEMAQHLGISARHLRRVVQAEFGVTPVELAQTQRLLVAKRLLTDTDLPMIEVALASGFGSLRRFNALFQQRYRLNPSELRKTRTSATAGDVLTCELGYRPPLDWAALAAFLSRRAWSGVEAFDGDRYLRTVQRKEHRGWIAVEPSRHRATLKVAVSASLARALLPVLARVKRLFDLAAEPQMIDAQLGDLVGSSPGLRVPGAFDGFEIAVRAIIGQQVSVQAATTIAGRIVKRFGEPIETPYPQLTHLAPVAARLAAALPEEVAALGIPMARSRALLALAEAVADGRIVLEPGGDVHRTMQLLQDLPGIGEWTAQYVAMRALGWPDAFPHHDLGIRKALGAKRPNEVLEIAEAWRPWRAYAVMHLWKGLEPKT